MGRGCPLTTAPSLYVLPTYHVIFGNSGSKGVRINNMEPEIGDRWALAPLRWGRE